MPLKVVFDKGEWCPVVVCDHCGERITDARQGNYQWQHDGETVVFTHKKCCRDYESAHGGRQAWLWADITWLPRYLAVNLKNAKEPTP